MLTARHTIHCILILWLLLIGAAHSYSQASKTPLITTAHGHFIHYPTSNGLSNTWISDIHQSADGFIWIATQYGLNRYDGTSFESHVYSADDTSSLSNNWVQSICEGRTGDLWLGPYGMGLQKYDPVMETFSNYLEDPQDNCHVKGIIYMVADAKDQLWISHGSGTELVIYKNGNCLSRIPNPDRISRGLATDKWVILQGSKHIIVYDPITLTEVDRYQAQQGIKAMTISGDQLYFSEGILLKTMTISSNGLLSAPITLVETEMNINALAATERTIYMAGALGLMAYDLDNGMTTLHRHQPSQPNSIIGGELLNLLVDKDKNLWIGGREGLCMMPHVYQSFEASDVPPGLSKVQRTFGILPTPHGTYIGTEKGLFYWDNDPAIAPISLLQNYRIRSLLQAADGYIYVGISSPPNKPDDPRILKLDPRDHSMSISLLSYQDEESMLGMVLALVEDDRGGIIATLSNQVFYKKRDEDDFINITAEIPFNFATAGILLNAVIDKQGHLWLGSMQSGLIKINWKYGEGVLSSDGVTQYTYDPSDPHSICSNFIPYLFVSKDGTLWIATDGGFNSLDANANQFQRYTRAQGLISDKILSITEDDYGRLWMATISQGLLCVDSSRSSFVFYQEKSGIYHDAFLLKSVGRSDDGKLYFGNEGGIQIFHPLPPSSSHDTIPPPRFSTLHINNNPIHPTTSHILAKAPEYTSSITLNHLEKNISVSYAHPTYGPYYNYKYKYRLLGAGQDWIDIASLKQISFAQLSPGKYSLEVAACLDLSCVQATPLNIYIRPPWWNNSIAWIGYLLSFLGMVYLVVQWRERSSINLLQLEKKAAIQQAQSRFFTNMTHELRTPLTLISGPVQRLMDKQLPIDATSKTQLSSIKTNADHMLQLVNNLLDFSKMEAGMMPVQERSTAIAPFLYTIIDSFRPDAQHRDIELITEIDDSQLTAAIDREKIRIILSNLIANALHYSTSGDTVHIDVITGASLQLSIADTGMGMTEDEATHLFDRYYRGAATSAIGTGVGMSLVSEIVDLMKGTIHVDSTKGKGTTITVSLTLTALDNPAPIADVAQQLKTAHDDRTTLPILLLIEDHPDVALYVTQGLTEQYRVITATDGQQGCMMAIERLPDIIITDVMMPAMDGYQVCRHLKSHPLTDHIPVIMLTARADQSSRLEGMDAGADAFLTKPFDDRELSLLLHNLLTTRDSILKKYGTEDKIHDNHADLPPFLKNATEQILLLIDQNQLTVPDLCNALHVSRAQLHRKLKAATGQSTTQYINSIKLEKAATLLTTTELSVSEVLYKSGFNHPSYFSQLFSERYGCTPGEYREKDSGTS